MTDDKLVSTKSEKLTSNGNVSTTTYVYEGITIIQNRAIPKKDVKSKCITKDNQNIADDQFRHSKTKLRLIQKLKEQGKYKNPEE